MSEPTRDPQNCVSRVLHVAVLVAFSATANHALAVDAGAWADEIVLENPWIRLVVVPSIGRAVFLGAPQGANLLWVNPETRGLPLGAAWIDFGGEKLWPWPQATWGRWTSTGGIWPPPDRCEGPFQVTARTPSSLTIVAPSLSPWGLTVTRRYDLDPVRTACSITTSMRNATTREAGPVSAWQNAQMQPAVRVAIEGFSPSAIDRGPQPMIAGTWSGWRRHGATWETTTPPSARAKVGASAARLRWFGAQGQAALEVADPDDGFAEQAQVYSSPLEGAGIGHLELEFAGVPRVLKPGEESSLQVRWSLPGTAAAE